MKELKKVPGGKAAIIAFAVTVLLGAGGSIAVGLWQQTATTTMTVSAAPVWPGDQAVLNCVTSTNPNIKTATLTATPTASGTMTAALKNANGAYGTEYSVGSFPGTLDLGSDTTGVKEALNGAAGTVRLTVTFTGYTRQALVSFAGNGKATCA
ncbi:hypothetical protein R5O87_10900 [Arthrobacter globiformis]|uniref:hypothetical protein n=1 Tax=Arthrobacter globiformis TaxID=1665 RepID=UPI00397C871D